MTSFFGTETYAIDHKGRVSDPGVDAPRAPARKPLDGVRPRCAASTAASRSTRPNEWTRVEERLQPHSDRRTASGRAFARAFLMDASKVTVDAQGRITIPPALIAPCRSRQGSRPARSG